MSADDVREPRKKNKSTAAFWRAFRYLGPHRRIVAISITCAFLVGLTSAGGMGALLPVLRLLFNDDTLQNYAARIVAESRLGARLSENPEEVRLLKVEKGAAAEAGLKKNDVIQAVKTSDMLQTLADPAASEAHLQIARGKGALDVTLKLPTLRRHNRMLIEIANRLPKNVVYSLAVVLGLMCALTVLGNGIRFFQEYYSDKAAILAVNDIRRQLYDHVLHIPLGFFGMKGTSDVTSRLVQDAAGLQDGFKTVLGQSVQEPIKAAMFFAVAVYWDWRLTLGIVVFGPLLFAVIKKFGKKMRRASRKALQSSATMLGQLEGTLIGIRVVKAGGAERFERRRYSGIMKGLVAEQLKMSRIDAFSTPLLETIIFFVVCAVVIYAAYLMRVTGDLEPTKFMGVMTCLAVIGESLRKFSKVNNALQKSNAAAVRIFETMDVPGERQKLVGSALRSDLHGSQNGPQCGPYKNLPLLQRDIRFENLTFSYANATSLALKNVNLIVPKGQSVAIVGRNGSGKTTLLALLPRFYDPQQGRVLIDGVDIQGATLRSLRRQIGIVTQEAVIFPGSIAENIAYGQPLAKRDDIIAAARRAFAHDFILEKQNGYDTILGEHGAQLSGGQRQRLCIARAILRQTPILILDEATSQVDAESEHLIQQAIESLMHERTTFVIAHRFSTILSADTIVVMEKGEIAGQGKHAELLETCEVYQQLYERQLFAHPV
jgi:ABC-type multidrug transport system fused ATPase/permease subunit